MRPLPPWRVFPTILLGILLEPVGHACAYLLRYGPTQAWQLQSQGGHSAFPRLLSFSSISLTVILALGLLVAVSVRLVLGGRPVDRIGLPSTFVLMAVTQCGFFGVKETLEALALQTTPDLISIGILALLVQLPLAAVGALLISWFRGYLELAPEAIRAMLSIRVAPDRGAHLLRPLPALGPRKDLERQRWFQRRGPPVSL